MDGGIAATALDCTSPMLARNCSVRFRCGFRQEGRKQACVVRGKPTASAPSVRSASGIHPDVRATRSTSSTLNCSGDCLDVMRIHLATAARSSLGVIIEGEDAAESLRGHVQRVLGSGDIGVQSVHDQQDGQHRRCGGLACSRTRNQNGGMCELELCGPPCQTDRPRADSHAKSLVARAPSFWDIMVLPASSELSFQTLIVSY